MGLTALNRIARTLGWKVDPDPSPEGPIVLTYEEFADAVEMLRDTGFPMERSAEEAWADFRGWRVNYETIGIPAVRSGDRTTGAVVGTPSSPPRGIGRSPSPTPAAHPVAVRMTIPPDQIRDRRCRDSYSRRDEGIMCEIS